jgi:hypothetical protein
MMTQKKLVVDLTTLFNKLNTRIHTKHNIYSITNILQIIFCSSVRVYVTVITVRIAGSA